MTQLQERWIKGERWGELAQILELPVVKDALAILEEEADVSVSLPALIAMTAQLTAADGASRVSAAAFGAAGMRSAVKKLRRLGKVYTPPAKQDVPEAFSHINADNYEQYLNQQ